MKSGPIILIEDDEDDQAIFVQVLNEIDVTNKIVWFRNCIAAFHYLKTTSDQPFIIFCDVNLPVRTGIEFKKDIDQDPQLRKKSIPFIFYSTAVSKDVVNEAFTQLTIQGFFQKENKYDEIKKNIKTIIDYWVSCKHPNTF